MWCCGYVYDSETDLYYLQSRYYDAKIGRFLNADVYASTGQGVLGNNMFAYCLNNPILLSDPTGGMALISSHILGVNTDDNQEKRDVTDEIVSVLTKAAKHARHMRSQAKGYSIFNTKRWETLSNIYTEFYSLVNHEAPWDIKRSEVWKITIGTPFPGEGTEVIFAGNVMTPESLGNFTYGYLGYSYGIPLEILIGGSYYAAGFPVLHSMPVGIPIERYFYCNADYYNEINDWRYIKMGYEYAQNGYLE